MPIPVSKPTNQMRVGVDVTAISDVRASLAQFGDRYRTRMYTEAEIAYCTSASCSEIEAERFAARFAAKEAVVKVLRPRGQRPKWTSIEVVRQPDGWCEIQLSDYAADMARHAGIADMSLSMSHEAGIAFATVIATTTGESAQ